MMNSMKTVELLSTFLILGVCSLEACMNTNSVSVTSDTESVCPSQSVTARCVVTSTQTPIVLIWECEGQGGAMQERIILCNSGNMPLLALNCKDGDVELTLSSCTCNDSTITSDAMFVATSGSGRLTCTDNANQHHGYVSLGIEDPPTPVLSFSYSHIYDVEKNNFANVTIEWSSSGSEQYQYRVSISSPNSDSITITTSATMINVTLEIGVDYGITVTAERCSGSVTSMTSEPLDIILPVPDAVERCQTIPAYNEGNLDHIELNWTALPNNNSVSVGAAVALLGYEFSFISNQTVSTFPLRLECTTTCQHNIMQQTLPDTPFNVSVTGENRFGFGQTTRCTGDEINLRNIFLNVTEFNKTVISILLTVDQERISVYCGKETSKLQLCATDKGPFKLEEPVLLDTLQNYTTEFQPDTIYYYQIETGSIIVSGSIMSGELDTMPSADASFTALTGIVIGVVIAILVILSVVVVITVILLIWWKSHRQPKSDAKKDIEMNGSTTEADVPEVQIRVKMTSISKVSTIKTPDFQGRVIPNTPEGEMTESQNGGSYCGKDIKGLYITETMLICSDEENKEGVVIVFKRGRNQTTELQRILTITGLKTPRGVALNSEENRIYVVESGKNRILKFDIQGKCVGESPDDVDLFSPRGLVEKNEWIFVCDTSRNKIKILDKYLQLRFDLHNDSVINNPQDIACLFDRHLKSYTLCIAPNNQTVVVLQVDLDGQPRILREVIITQSIMKIELKTNMMRSICIVEEKFIYVTEMRKGGRILCLNLKSGRYVNSFVMEPKVWPKLIANHGETIIYTVFTDHQYSNCGILFMQFLHKTSD